MPNFVADIHTLICKNMKRFIAIMVIMCAIHTTMQAQDYSSAIGVRINNGMSGVSFKHKMNPTDAIEAVLSIPYDGGIGILGLYERHLPVIDEGFNFYYGAGANIGSYDFDNKTRFAMGIDGVVGLEYKINAVPLAFSLDYAPNLNLIGYQNLDLWNFALGIKITF